MDIFFGYIPLSTFYMIGFFTSVFFCHIQCFRIPGRHLLRFSNPLFMVLPSFGEGSWEGHDLRGCFYIPKVLESCCSQLPLQAACCKLPCSCCFVGGSGTPWLSTKEISIHISHHLPWEPTFPSFFEVIT